MGNQVFDSIDWIIENDFCQILRVVLEFFAKGLNSFLQPIVLHKPSEITVGCPNSLQMNNKSQFWPAKSQKNDYQF